ncbi:MAG TPA: hypothetical protein VIY10_09000 [Solirubrobacteraceae bacterium]
MRLGGCGLIARVSVPALMLAAAALSIVAPAQARTVRPKPGYYLGYSGAYSLSFKLSARATTVTGLTTDFQANSENGGCMPAAEEVHVRFASMAITGGAFHGTAHPSSATPTTDAIRGRFTSATRVSGTIGESYTITSLPPCRGSEPFVAQYVGPTASSAASVLTVTSGGRKATFTNVGAQFGNLVTPTGTPTLGTAGTAFFTVQARRLSAAQSRALKGPITSTRLHLVIAGSPFVNTTYAFTGTHVTGLASTNPGTQQITLSYADVRKAR